MVRFIVYNTSYCELSVTCRIKFVTYIVCFNGVKNSSILYIINMCNT